MLCQVASKKTLLERNMAVIPCIGSREAGTDSARVQDGGTTAGLIGACNGVAVALKLSDLGEKTHICGRDGTGGFDVGE